jgi:proteasome beta subunit
MQPQTDAADAEGLDTGTTVVGIVADGGETEQDADYPAVVIATDRRASLGRMVSSKSVQKVQRISDRAAMAFSGSVSGADALTKSLRSEISLYETRRAKRMSPRALGNLVANNLRENQFGVQPVVAAVDDSEASLFSYDGAGGQTEVDYAAVGSGTPYAYGHLEDAYESGLSVEEATDLAESAVAVATERDTASGNGLCLAVVRAGGVEIEMAEEIGA